MSLINKSKFIITKDTTSGVTRLLSLCSYKARLISTAYTLRKSLRSVKEFVETEINHT